jgi:hypothetical protein
MHSHPLRFPLARRPLAVAIWAGCAYFGTVFALGFLLGTVRTLFVADTPGERRLLGVLLELPVMLAASWFACRWIVRAAAVAPDITMRALMGGTAFVLLIVAEMVVGVGLFHRSPAEHFALYRDASYAIGLAAQVVFAAMPVLRLRYGVQPK